MEEGLEHGNSRISVFSLELRHVCCCQAKVSLEYGNSEVVWTGICSVVMSRHRL